MQVTRSTNMADIIHMNYMLLPVINRFGIQLGFGDKTVEKICAAQHINIDFFLEIINSFHDTSYFPESHLQSFPLKMIIEYIKKSHDYYIKLKVPQIDAIIQEILSNTPADHRKELDLITKFYNDYKEELITHIKKEEDEMHPYVLALDALHSDEKAQESTNKITEQYRIGIFADEHDNMEDKLFDLKNIIIKYLPPVDNYALSNTLLVELFRLERDLNDHARIEDKVLVPKVQWLEKQLF
jgi:regulator of cell morphogenesis and NO signaling